MHHPILAYTVLILALLVPLAVKSLCKAKVAKFEVAIFIQEKVLGLEIPVCKTGLHADEKARTGFENHTLAVTLHNCPSQAVLNIQQGHNESVSVCNQSNIPLCFIILAKSPDWTSSGARSAILSATDPQKSSPSSKNRKRGIRGSQGKIYAHAQPTLCCCGVKMADTLASGQEHLYPNHDIGKG